jgi:hypothetical protein
MFPWFISPWEAARLSFEAQRVMMSLPWLYFASARREERPPLPATPMVTRPRNVVSARQATENRKASPKARRKKDKTSRRKEQVRKR